MKKILIFVLFFSFSMAAISLLEKENVVEIYKKRRETLIERLKTASEGHSYIALCMADEPKDLTRFFQNNDFYYLTGVETPKAALAILESRYKSNLITLFLPPKDAAAERWTGHVVNAGDIDDSGKPNADRKEAIEATGIENIDSVANLESNISIALMQNPFFFLGIQTTPMNEDLNVSQELAIRIRNHFPTTDFRNLNEIIHDMRRVKDDHEVSLTEKACSITEIAHREMLKGLIPGMKENQAQAIIEGTFMEKGAMGPAFPSIVGSGPYSCILHYDKNDREMKAGDLVVLDIGARYGYYCADVTRTFPVSGKFTKRQKEIYNIVLEAQKKAIDAVKPGLRVKDIHKVAQDFIKEKGYGDYFFHGTSHYLGMDTHDVGSYEKPLEAGVIITVEPGIYIAKEEIGIRIEDDVLVTKDGHKVLSHSPKEIDEIESMMSKPENKGK